MRNIRTITAVLLSFCALLLGSSATAKTISLPLSIDPQLLRSMIVKAAFTNANRTAVLVDEPGGCKRIILSEPRYVAEQGRIIFETKVFVRAGFEFARTCILPFTWEGYVTLVQVPLVSDGWVLSFRTIESAVYDENHEPAHVMEFLWNLIQRYVLEYLGQLTINLAPPVEDLRAFTKEVFPAALQDRAQHMVESFRPGRVRTGPQAISVEILTDTEEEPAGGEVGEGAPLMQEELEKFISSWETWDSFFVRMVTSLPSDQLSTEERDLILDVLLQTRYRFEEELLQSEAEEDFVRKEFVKAWSRLSPLFRKRMTGDPGRPLFDYLAFFTASDALVALDELGKGLGIEISREGLIRLARLISSKEVTDLPYDFAVDVELRNLLGVGDPLPFTEPSPDGDSIDIDPGEESFEEEGPSLSVKSFFLGTAWAESDTKGLRDRITPWLVPKGDIQPYLKRVKSLLSEASTKIFSKSEIESGLRDFYNLLVFSTAWQESCFRQFTVKGGKITYLRSYNGTSVGIMQINERVWRGIYEEKHLQWDIRYNAEAGCEVLGLYLRKYALPAIKAMGPRERLDQQSIARIVYAMYCGGPGQCEQFKERLKRGRTSKIDNLFLQKYLWVKGNEWDKIEKCL